MKAWVFCFALMFISDVFWVLCVRSVQAGRALLAGLWAVGIFIPTAFITVGYVTDPTLIIPTALGHFFGTMCTVLWDNRNKQRNLNHENTRS